MRYLLTTTKKNMKNHYDTNQELEIKKHEAEFSKGMFRAILILCAVVLLAFNQGELKWKDTSNTRTDTIYQIADYQYPVVVKAKSKTKEDLDQITYINKYSEIFEELHKKTGVPLSVIIAQGILESDSGKSKIFKEKNNHFGITTSDGKSYKKYKTESDCFNDYVRVMKLHYYKDIKGDCYDWTKGLEGTFCEKKGYTKKLDFLIFKHNLERFDI